MHFIEVLLKDDAFSLAYWLQTRFSERATWPFFNGRVSMTGRTLP